jgi:hypothetical protein
VMLHPSQNRRARHSDAALAHHDCKIWIEQLSAQVPPNAQADKLVIEIVTCEDPDRRGSCQSLSFPRAAGFASEPYFITTPSNRGGRLRYLPLFSGNSRHRIGPRLSDFWEVDHSLNSSPWRSSLGRITGLLSAATALLTGADGGQLCSGGLETDHRRVRTAPARDVSGQQRGLSVQKPLSWVAGPA